MALPVIITETSTENDTCALMRDLQDLMTDFVIETLTLELLGPGPDNLEQVIDGATTALLRVKDATNLKSIMCQLKHDRPWVGLRAALAIFPDGAADIAVPPLRMCDKFIGILQETWLEVNSFASLETVLEEGDDVPAEVADDAVAEHYVQELKNKYQALCNEKAPAGHAIAQLGKRRSRSASARAPH